MTDKNQPSVTSFGYRKPRFRTDFRLLIQLEGRPPKLIDARCLDISEDGLAAQLPEDLEVGTRVIFVMTPPGSSRSIRIPGRVNNRTEQQHGFIFIFNSRAERDSVQVCLACLRPEPISFRGPK